MNHDDDDVIDDIDDDDDDDDDAWQQLKPQKLGEIKSVSDLQNMDPLQMQLV